MGAYKESGMSGIVRQTYLLLSGYNLNGRKLWVTDKQLIHTWPPFIFNSIDGKQYRLFVSDVRPKFFVIPYELFIEDEYISE